jgi:hypothetical protein
MLDFPALCRRDGDSHAPRSAREDDVAAIPITIKGLCAAAGKQASFYFPAFSSRS